MGRHQAAIRLAKLVQQFRGDTYQVEVFVDLIYALETRHPAFYKVHWQDSPKSGRQWIGRLESGEIAHIIHFPEFIDALGIALNCTPQQQSQLYAAVGLDPLTTFDPLRQPFIAMIREMNQALIVDIDQGIRMILSNCPSFELDDATRQEYLVDAVKIWLKQFER